MPTLSYELRNLLENTVKTARRQAETAAKAALERLTVGGAEPGGHLSSEERQLRNRLRAHGRQLGDQRDAKTGTQSTSRLLHECAYEHWHRMLFARFLAENHLLIHDKEGMPVTLAECDELAADEGAPDGWTWRHDTRPGCYLKFSGLTTRSSRSALRRSTSVAWKNW